MSLLTICQRAASELGLRQPSVVVGSDDLTAQILFEQANAAGKHLVGYHDWQALTVEATLTATGSVSLPALPAAFDRLIARAEVWNATNSQKLVGPTPQRYWRELQSGVALAGGAGFWRLLGGVLQVRPAVTSGDLITFEYISKNFCASAGGTGQALFAADTDTAVIPEDLFILEVIWRFRKSRGFRAYAEDMETAEREKEKAASRDRGTGRMQPGRRADVPEPPFFSGVIDT